MSTHSLDDVDLPGDMLWIDENAEQLAQQEIRTITGKLIVFSKAVIAGRKITLSGHPRDNWAGAWVPWSTVEALLDLVTPGHIMTLQYGERDAISVTWAGAVPVQYQSVAMEFEPKQASDLYTVELRMIMATNTTVITS